MTLPNGISIEGKNVLIIGSPASGKTTYAKELFVENGASHVLVHTDDYIKFGYKEALYMILDDLALKYRGAKTIVEGVQGYRMLRKGLELGSYSPDLVIELSTSDSKVEEVYGIERDPYKLKYLKGFNTMHQKILTDYKLGMAAQGKSLPEWVQLKLH